METAGTAMMVLATSAEVPASALEALRNSPGILSVSHLRG
jgi:hypothetical protein